MNHDYLQVRLSLPGELPCCPICLEVPTAPQVTKCGHVFCFGCFLHHAAGADKNWSHCPICFEMVYVEDLRSATLLPTAAIAVGDTLQMTLMTIAQGIDDSGWLGLHCCVASTRCWSVKKLRCCLFGLFLC